jgi:glycosyltransferase involved in cell wall biosynthesis
MKLLMRHPDVHFAGARIGTDLAAHYASADIFLYPSLTETYGNVTVEALASGLAVVAYRYAAAAQHIRHGENGISIAYGDREAFIRAALDLMSDRESRARLGARARATMLPVDWDEIVSDFESTLVRLTNEHAGGTLGRAIA